MAEFKDIANEDDGFARRWSRLKQESRLHENMPPTPEQAPEADDVAAEPLDPEDLPPEDPPPEDLPNVDSLDADSDYTPFMREGVPDDIKNMALRKLWRTDAVFANLDGLNDYDEDFATILKAGEAFMERLAEAARSAAEDGTEGPRYPTASYANAESLAEEDDSTELEDVRPEHPSGADHSVERTVLAGEDEDDRTA